jgi:hypothetical protein
VRRLYKSFGVKGLMLQCNFFPANSTQPGARHLPVGVKHTTQQLLQPGGREPHLLQTQLPSARQPVVPLLYFLEWSDRRVADLGERGASGPRFSQQGEYSYCRKHSNSY